ncbi:MAG TPA: CoA activase, partial [Verrucomicrobiales bacterium]|nr:CoA activase [Verrucomicrobiales bacterium]
MDLSTSSNGRAAPTGRALSLGIDVGSVTVKAVLLDTTGRVLESRYQRSHGKPRQTLHSLLQEIASHHDLSNGTWVGLTGSGGEAVSHLLGGRHVNELIAQTRGLQQYHPEARTVIEIGGQDSKFLQVELDPGTGRMDLVDFAMNNLCAAGTGAFLDQQAERLGIAIEGEFGRLALLSEKPARIAGRCTVFAKSDMIHLQQKGTPMADILAGLCQALARNFTTVVARGKRFLPPVVFQGGVAFNLGVVRAFESVLGLEPRSLIVPEHHPFMAAIGTGLLAAENGGPGTPNPFPGLEGLLDLALERPLSREARPPLHRRPALPSGGPVPQPPARPDGETGRPLEVALGIDVGSVSTKAVLIDAGGGVVSRRYRMTAGRPLEAVAVALREIGQEAGPGIRVTAVGVTGSGRELTGEFVGADLVRNEITCQARAAIACHQSVDTLFEIGGQDSKYTRIEQGTVVDFAMNNACAAGTGSFLEEQADRLRVRIEDEFSNLAFASPHPASLGCRCTVFMESDIVHHQQEGAELKDLTAGLACAIVENYLTRVVAGRPVGRTVLFQGGVAFNPSVVAAFERRLGRSILVPPHHEVTGAIGAATLAMEERGDRLRRGEAGATSFRGFELGDRGYRTTCFTCKGCSNLCEINRVVFERERPLFFGARCDRFDATSRTPVREQELIPDLFKERNDLLLGGHVPPPRERTGRPRIAIPRALSFHDLFPYWRAFFDSLGIEVELSSPTNPATRSRTASMAAIETCFPAKLLFGHVSELLQGSADWIFLPCVANREAPPGEAEENMYCPIIPASANLVLAQLPPVARQRIVTLPLHLQWGGILSRELDTLADRLGVGRNGMRQARQAGEQALREFHTSVQIRGREALGQIPPGMQAGVLVGRPYNTCDPGVCLDLPFKLRRMGVLPIPMDYLPLDSAGP